MEMVEHSQPTPSDKNMRIAEDLAKTIRLCIIHDVANNKSTINLTAVSNLVAAALQAKDAYAAILRGQLDGKQLVIQQLEREIKAKDAERERAVKEAREKALVEAIPSNIEAARFVVLVGDEQKIIYWPDDFEDRRTLARAIRMIKEGRGE